MSEARAAIDLYFWPTPNGQKVSIALEEMELRYELVPVNIRRGEQFAPDFITINPNNRIPALVDRAPLDGGQPLAVFESGAILTYLARKGGRFLPRGLRAEVEVLQWVIWQCAGLGPMAGQLAHFLVYAPEPIPYALDLYTKEVDRLFGVMDRQLAGRDFLCGDYSIADMAALPWATLWRRLGQNIADFPRVGEWLERVGERAGVKRGLAVGADLSSGPPDNEARRVLVGQTARSVRQAADR
jgi:GST-like protein